MQYVKTNIITIFFELSDLRRVYIHELNDGTEFKFEILIDIMCGKDGAIKEYSFIRFKKIEDAKKIYSCMMNSIFCEKCFEIGCDGCIEECPDFSIETKEHND